jgi:hypothetical protein
MLFPRDKERDVTHIVIDTGGREWSQISPLAFDNACLFRAPKAYF